LPIKKAPEEQPSHGLAYSSTVRKDDGRLEVFVAPDSMSASADLYPPLGDGAPISADYAAELLARLGICCGVDWELLNERILEANTEGHIQRAVAIAKGIAPVDAVAEHIVPIASLLPGFVPVDDRELSVDWKNLKPYSIVKKDEPVAAIAPMKNGITGSDIYGKDISYATLNPTAYSLGKNLERRGDQIVALIDGRLCLDGAKLSVENVLMVKGDVDFRVGHIMFPGDVIIEGGVASGFKVYSGGSISIKETMDAFDVSAKKDLLCAQGIIGKEQGFVRVGGNLKGQVHGKRPLRRARRRGNTRFYRRFQPLRAGPPVYGGQGAHRRRRGARDARRALRMDRRAYAARNHHKRGRGLYHTAETR
jgi:uncharacterized protein